jgi:hypothetical protein
MQQLRDGASSRINNINIYLFPFHLSLCNHNYKELDVLAVSALRRAIAEVKQRWSVIG